MEWYIKRQYIAEDKIITEYWNRYLQSWQDRQGGKGYTERGVHRLNVKLFRQSYELRNLSVSTYRQDKES